MFSACTAPQALTNNIDQVKQSAFHHGSLFKDDQARLGQALSLRHDGPNSNVQELSPLCEISLSTTQNLKSLCSIRLPV